MKRTMFTKALIAGCAIAMAAACNDRNSANAGRDAAAPRAGQPADGRDNTARETPITVTGCLQQGDGRAYILTRVNEPSQKSVGTSGQEGAVQREQMRSAADSYRIDPSGDMKIDDLVGKQVKVNGTLAEPADLPKDNDAGGVKIKEGDLARIDAVTVSIVSENCR